MLYKTRRGKVITYKGLFGKSLTFTFYMDLLCLSLIMKFIHDLLFDWNTIYYQFRKIIYEALIFFGGGHRKFKILFQYLLIIKTESWKSILSIGNYKSQVLFNETAFQQITILPNNNFLKKNYYFGQNCLISSTHVVLCGLFCLYYTTQFDFHRSFKRQMCSHCSLFHI